jgi:PAS domain S-box-containing protein
MLPYATVLIDWLSVFESVPGLYLVLTLDLRVITATEAFVNALESSRENVVGHPLEAVAWESESLSEAFRPEEFLASVHRVVRTRGPASMSTLELKTSGVATYEPCSSSQFWKRTNFPLFDARGEVSRILHVCEDITELEQARRDIRRFEASLDAGEEKFRAFMDHYPAAAFLKDSAGRYLYTNATWRRQFDPEPIEWAGYTDFDFWPSETAELFQSSDRRCLEQGAAIQFEERVEDRSGQTHTFLVLKFPFRLHGRYVVGGMALDISAFERAEAEVRRLNEELEEQVRLRTADLEAANRELEAFSYSVSHDLRAPLRAVGGFARILARDCTPLLPAKSQKDLEYILANTMQMGQLIDDLLAFSRLGRQPLNRRPLDMNEIVSHCLEELQVSKSTRPVEIEREPLPPAYGDRALLKQVWLNLLSNSLKYSQSRDVRRIVIGSVAHSEHSPGPVYFVRDNGIGFEMRHAHKLFGVFQRLHSSEEFEGTGVGLAIVHRIILRHGGSIWAEAKAGGGATFFFRLGGEE